MPWGGSSYHIFSTLRIVTDGKSLNDDLIAVKLTESSSNMTKLSLMLLARVKMECLGEDRLLGTTNAGPYLAG